MKDECRRALDLIGQQREMADCCRLMLDDVACGVCDTFEERGERR